MTFPGVPQQDIRWKQRFQNFDRAVARLREPFERDVATLSELERAGTIRRFEVAVDFAGKTLRAYLESEGHVLDLVTPRSVLKAAFAAGILPDGQVWIDTLEFRMQLAHAYDAATWGESVLAIRDRYWPAIEVLHAWLRDRRAA